MNVKSTTLAQLSELLGARLEGDASLVIHGIGGLADAEPDQISFLANSKYARAAALSKAGGILVGLDALRPNPHSAILRVDNPSKAFAAVCSLFAPNPVHTTPGVSLTAHVAKTATIGPGVSIAPGAVIDEEAEIGADTVIGANTYVGQQVRIGSKCVLYPNVTVRERCIIGDEVILHAGAVIGADGFGFDLAGESHTKIPQIGIVRIDNKAEIGANTTIDRARFGQTWIQEGVKIDNLVQIAHNVVIGKHSVIVSQAGISGSTRIGQRVIIAGQAGLVGHIEIGDGAVITAQAGVSKDIPSRSVVSGYHARPLRDFQRSEALIKRLPELLERIRVLEQKLADREAGGNS